MSQLANSPKKKLKTSAMIASIATEGQPTKPLSAQTCQRSEQKLIVSTVR